MLKLKFTYFSLVGLHILIGIAIYLDEFLAKFYFLGIVGYFMARIILLPAAVKTYEVLKACAYVMGVEVLMRTTKGAISYEATKYLVMLFVMMGMYYKGISGKAYPYLIYLFFLVPPIIVASTTLSFDAHFRTNIAFVLSGPVCLGLAALFCYDKKITTQQLHTILLFALLPIIAHTVYIYFYNPTVRDVLSGTASNREASGGWGANQVATALGLGIFIITVRLFVKSPTLGLKLLNIGLLIGISYRAIVTFSRGGILTAVLSIIAFLVIYWAYVSHKKRLELFAMFIFFTIGIAMTWMISVQQTEGLIDLRYANKDQFGREKKDLTTGRAELFTEEIQGFISSPFWGIGISRSKDERIEEEGQGITSHSEVSRTLAEHGIFGVVILLILLFKPFAMRSHNRRNYLFYAFLVFWFVTINHSSMRIAAPAFIYALALLNVTYDPPPLHRKLLQQ